MHFVRVGNRKVNLSLVYSLERKDDTHVLAYVAGVAQPLEFKGDEADRLWRAAHEPDPFATRRAGLVPPGGDQ